MKFHGKSGTVQWGDEDISDIVHWECNMTADTAEVTPMTVGTAAAEWTQRLAGQLDWTATVDAKWNAPPIMSPGSDVLVELELFLDVTAAQIKLLHGNAICTGVSHTTDKDDIVATSYSFKGAGVLTYAEADV